MISTCHVLIQVPLEPKIYLQSVLSSPKVRVVYSESSKRCTTYLYLPRMNFITLAQKKSQKVNLFIKFHPNRKNMPPNSPNAWADFDFADEADVLVTVVTVLAACALACALAKGDIWGSCADVQTLSSRLRLRNKASPRPRFSMATLICRYCRIFKTSSKIYSKMNTMRTYENHMMLF